jgi:hypothetical protein
MFITCVAFSYVSWAYLNVRMSVAAAFVVPFKPPTKIGLYGRCGQPIKISGLCGKNRENHDLQRQTTNLVSTPPLVYGL